MVLSGLQRELTLVILQALTTHKMGTIGKYSLLLVKPLSASEVKQKKINKNKINILLKGQLFLAPFRDIISLYSAYCD